MSCPICAVVSKQAPGLLLYEDDLVMATLHPYPAVRGHIIIFPKQHVQIINLVEDAALAKMYEVAQKMSSVVFDGLGAQGTNILIQNGEAAGQTLPHFMMHVLPRSPGDGLPLDWQPKQLPPEELDSLEATFKDTIGQLVSAQNVVSATEGEENYLLKQLQRTP